MAGSGARARARALLALITIAVVAGCRSDAPDRPVTRGDGGLLVIEGEPSCGVCSIAVDTLFEVGEADDPVLFRKAPVLASDSRGFVYAYVPHADDHEILRLSPDGRSVGLLGSYGRGPGEFRVVYSLTTAPGDSIIVAHDGNAVSVFDSSGAYVRTRRLPFRPTGIVLRLPAGSYLTSGGTGRPDAPPVHLLNDDGLVLASGGSGNVVGSRYPERVLGLSNEGVWTAHPFNYLLEHSSTELEVLQRVLVRSTFPTRVLVYADKDEFQAAMVGAPKVVGGRPGQRVGSVFIAPPPRIASIRAGEDGYLWIVSHVPALDAYEVEAEYQADEFDVRLADESKVRMYSTAVDVLDLAAARIVVSAHFPGVGGLTQQGLFYVGRYTDEGLVRVLVGRLRIDGPLQHGRR